MFLVTYNFGDMPVNHMTFLRHRIFLVPAEEGVEGKGEASPGGGLLDRKKILCYLIHLRYDRGSSCLHYSLTLCCYTAHNSLSTGKLFLCICSKSPKFKKTKSLVLLTHFFGSGFLRFQSSKSGKIYLHNDIRLLFSRKSIEVDTGIPYELKSFTEVPRNPKYSPRV